ncbi:Protein phosphatase 2C domain-containing protein [Rozella allomycis CSF55]|uniref:Protein phosphatase 2C domain-containing protein n=1 Tax=Rozella allomycis (strain CSF55) TaxID=988480 RepID=A0A075AN31_ROZAC|nr:Protein phosphatase 2C domain-containing protein [Rozella allomycis CSF55]|eukprot:EPZ31161.1 Protein phosphatase 2C domain-containing protein [Rozella allomycis CSF55]
MSNTNSHLSGVAQTMLDTITYLSDESKNPSPICSSSCIKHRSSFQVGFVEDRNKRHRRHMEDAHCYEYDFGDVPDQGFFAIFDGHAGHAAAKWCGENFHHLFLKNLIEHSELSIPEVLNRTYQDADSVLDEKNGYKSGCTSVTCFLRHERILVKDSDGSSTPVTRTAVRLFFKLSRESCILLTLVMEEEYCRNRSGKAIRLTYDHKASDPTEKQRIIEANGHVINDRVNAVLAVTRALGDSYLKEHVVGLPFTTEVELTKDDEFIIIACDGLWDVCSDQNAVELIGHIENPQEAAKKLLNFALENCSTDNISVMVIRLNSK